MAENNIGFNVSSFIDGNKENKNLSVSTQVVPVSETTAAPKKRSSRKKDSSEISQVNPQSSMSYIQENIPYQMAYNDTNNQLDEAIMQLNMIGSEVMQDLQVVRSSKTLKGKYTYINDMTGNAVNIINAKISAIKEKNKTINDINNLEIKRIKELKINTAAEDDNTKIANLYHAFVNTPVGIGPGVLAPPTQNLMMTGGSDIPMYSIGNDQAAWEANLSPAEKRMVLDAKGAIETVVVYDENTGDRYFEVVDKTTRVPVPNVEKPDSSYIYDLDINIRGGFAKDSNRNTIYPLVVINNGNTSINEY